MELSDYGDAERVAFYAASRSGALCKGSISNQSSQTLMGIHIGTYGFHETTSSNRTTVSL
jgi:cytoplasmic iron level regulating protein YaaA (DUF328/UPF0246 family)